MYFQQFYPEIQEGIQACRNLPGAVLLDVRDPEEYAEGHIPGAVNLPLGDLEAEAQDRFPDMDTALFLYCVSGGRAGQAQYLLQEMGYTAVADIGGINNYTGPLER